MENTIGTVVGSTSPFEFSFHLRRFTAKLGDLVTVETEIPHDKGGGTQPVIVWGRIVELQRFNPFLPAEATVELADEGLKLTDTVLSNTRDQIEGRVLVLGRTLPGDFSNLFPLNYPAQPGAIVKLPDTASVRRILIGDDQNTHRIRIGSLIGRSDVEVSLKTNMLVARHIAILAMTGGGKTVASRRIIKELILAKYPVVILDPHGDYLSFWERRHQFQDSSIKLYYPNIRVNNENRGLIQYLVTQMTQGLSDPQRELLSNALEATKLTEDEECEVVEFLRLLMDTLHEPQFSEKNRSTQRAVLRALNLVHLQMQAMQTSNRRLRERLREYPFEPMPDPSSSPEKFVAPGQACIIYLGGYDHLTQSTIVAIVLRNLFEERASMRNHISPFLTVIEEAHNFIPSHGEGQAETPSVEIIRKVITEGRKFGVGLMLVSQRPSRLDETTLSQCNTFIVFRLVNPRDQGFVGKVMENLTPADSRLLPGFGPGEGIVSGQAVRFPLVIRIAFDQELVPKAIGDEDFVSQARSWSKSEKASTVQRSEDFEQALNHVDSSGEQTDP